MQNKNKKNQPKSILRVLNQRHNSRGYRLVDVRVEDPYEKKHTQVRKKIRDEIEKDFIPAITEYIDGRGENYIRGENNPVSERLYAKSPVLQAWRNQMPKAEALYPLQRPNKGVLSDGTKFDTVATEYFMHVLDGVGLRSRAVVMSKLMHDHFVDSKNHEIRWASLACGAAIPVYDAAASLKKHNKKIKLILADISGKALKFAEELGESEYDLHGNIETIKINILRLRKLIRVLGKERYDAIDILGFFEYLPDERWKYKKGLSFPGASEFLKAAYKLLKPGGMLVFGNMSDQHPQLKFTTAVVQWPLIRPRSVDSIADLIEHAGIALEDVDIFRLDDQVYNVVAIYK